MEVLSTSIAIIGTGELGRAVSQVLVQSRNWDRVFIASRKFGSAGSLAMDLEDFVSSTGSQVGIHPVPQVEMMMNCDLVVVALRAKFTNANKPNERIGGLRANAWEIARVAQDLQDYSGTILVATNPVDPLSNFLANQLPSARVFGVGSNLDSARLRVIIAEQLGVDPRVVLARVEGTHDEEMHIRFSDVRVRGLPIKFSSCQEERIRGLLLERSRHIRQGVGRTRYGPSGAILRAAELATGIQDGVTELAVPYGTRTCGMAVRFVNGNARVLWPELGVRNDEAAIKLQLTPHFAPREGRDIALGRTL